MKNSKPRLTVIEKQGEHGLYVWQTPEGKIVTDGDGNTMNIPARRGDIEAISKITKAAAYYGFPEGKAVFRAGQRRVTEEEYSEQLDRMKEGYIPSETDLGAWYEAARGIGKHGSD
jgi:hypothetical protein